MIKFNKKTTGGNPLTNVDVSVTSGIQHGGTDEPSLRFSFSERITMMYSDQTHMELPDKTKTIQTGSILPLKTLFPATKFLE